MGISGIAKILEYIRSDWVARILFGCLKEDYPPGDEEFELLEPGHTFLVSRVEFVALVLQCMPVSDAVYIFKHLVEYMLPNHAAEILKHMPADRAAKILKHMPADYAAEILSYMKEGDKK